MKKLLGILVLGLLLCGSAYAEIYEFKKCDSDDNLLSSGFWLSNDFKIDTDNKKVINIVILSSGQKYIETSEIISQEPNLIVFKNVSELGTITTSYAYLKEKEVKHTLQPGSTVFENILKCAE